MTGVTLLEHPSQCLTSALAAMALPKNWIIVAGGQACSLLTALTGPCASAMANRGVRSPAAVNAPAYLLMGTISGCRVLARSWRNRGVESTVFSKKCVAGRAQSAVAWLILGLIDVEANCLAVYAYDYTSLTSVMLLDCFTIPCVMVLSKLMLKAQYTRTHAVGAAVCAVGLGLTVLSDVLPTAYGGDSASQSAPRRRRRFFGDMLALGGATLYAVSNVAQEFIVKCTDPAAVLSRLGPAGALISTLQAVATGQVTSLRRGVANSLVVRVALFGYVVSLAFLYIVASLFLQVADAAALNLSLLTSDAWAITFSALLTHAPPPLLYFVALATTASGVIIYHSVPSPTASQHLHRPLLLVESDSLADVN